MEPRQLLKLARKWFWLLILAAALGGAAGFIVGLRQPKTYQADTTLIVSTPNRSDWNALAGDQQAAKGFTLFPKSTPVLAATLQAIGETRLTIDQLMPMVTVDYTRDTQFIVIHVKDTDPNQAARLSTEIARQSVIQYQKVTTDGVASRKFIQEDLDKIETQINKLQKELTQLQEQPLSGDDITDRATTARLKDLGDSLNALRQSYNQIISAYLLVNNSQPKIIQEAEVPTKSLGTGPTLGGVIGLIVGLIVIMGVILLVEMTDDVARTPEKVALATGLSTLATVKYKAIGLNTNHALLADSKSIHPMSNRLPLPDTFLTLGAYLRSERSRLVLDGTPVNSVLVTSPEKGDGKTLTAIQLAVGLARTGTKVILVDANLRAPSVHEVFNLPNQSGLSTLLNNPEETVLTDVLQATSEPNLALLAGGPVVDFPSELLSSPELGKVLQELQAGAFVIIDSPSILTGSEPIILANKSDAVLLVLNATHTSVVKLKRSVEIITPINLNILGVVLNRTSN